MGLYRKKPVVIEAWQWEPGAQQVGVNNATPDDDDGCWDKHGLLGPHVHTMHNGGKSWVLLEQGDWIIPEPDGIHHYPVKDAVFRATYDPVEAQPGQEVKP